MGNVVIGRKREEGDEGDAGFKGSGSGSGSGRGEGEGEGEGEFEGGEGYRDRQVDGGEDVYSGGDGGAISDGVELVEAKVKR